MHTTDHDARHRLLNRHAEWVADHAAQVVPGFASIVWKGSSRKAWRSPYDFIPGVSDIDIHVYVDGEVDPQAGRRIEAASGPGPGGSPTQVMVLDRTDLPDGWMLLPEAYTVLRGEDPEVELPSYDRMVGQAYERMLPARRTAEQLEAELNSTDDPWSMLVERRSAFTPMLYRAAIHFADHDPAKVWTLSRSEIIDATDGTAILERLRHGVIDYLQATIEAAHDRHEPASACQALLEGIDVLFTVAEMVEPA